MLSPGFFRDPRFLTTFFVCLGIVSGTYIFKPTILEKAREVQLEKKAKDRAEEQTRVAAQASAVSAPLNP